MTDLTNILGGPWSPPAKIEPDPPEIQLKRAMEAAGLTPPAQVVLDGKLHRFQSGTKGTAGKGDKSGWYAAFSDGVPAGRFGCWRMGMEVPWRADIGRSLTPAEEMANARRMAEAKRLRDAEDARGREVAASTVAQIWADCTGADAGHPYLQRKGIQPNGARVTGDGRLVVPLYNRDGALTSLQYIEPEGGKLYHSGGQTGGCFWMIGTMDEPGVVYVAEGFATAATIHEATNRPCAVAYSASNLPAVAEALGGHVTIVADNDASGVGQKYADQASAKFGARVVMPPIDGDANDYVQAGHDLKTLLMPLTGQAVLSKLKVVFGDQLSTEFEAPNELVENLMTIGSTTVVYGDSNSGKTFWALSVAAAIATGAECYGRKTDPGLVVYLACEAPGSIRSRLQAIKRFYGCELENLAMIPVPLNFYNGETDSSDVIEAIREIERIKGKPVRLVIADTLARMSAGANENSGEDMGPVMARFEQVCLATGAAMMIIHHNGKDAAKGARGWSGIRAHIDTEIEVSEKEGIRSASVTKQRELPGKGEAIYFKLEIIEMGETKFGGQATTCVAVPDEESSERKPHQKPSKHDENARIWERAWWASGAEVRDGLPYVSRSAMKDFLASSMGYADRTIENKVDPSRSNGIVMPMLNAGVIEIYEHGWKIVDPVKSGAMLMGKKGTDQ